jgi:glycosyltransferase involved in cell wall biosynthesis
MIKFSVIIPLYNKGNYIDKTLQSVLSQTYTDFEVIVVNDGSTDNSLNVVMKIKDNRLRIFTKENEGVSIARNYGIIKAQYDYVAFLDADDLWMPDYLCSIVKLIRTYPQAGVYATTYIINEQADNACNVLKEESINFENTILIDDYCKALIKRKIILLWTGAICVNKKLFIEAGLFPQGVKRGEDLDMWLRLSLKTPIAIMNSPQVIYNKITENNAAQTYHSYKESFPYWKWYNYGISPYLKKYTTLQIIALIKVALKNKVYKDIIFLFFKIKGLYFIPCRLSLIMRAILRM